MAEGNTTRITILADGSTAIDGIGKVDLAMNRLGQRTGSTFDQMKQNWVAYTAAIYAAAASMQKIFSLMEAAAEHAEKMETLDALTRRYGTTAEGIVGSISDMSHGLIGVGAAANVAADALAKGFSPQQVAQMANVAAVMHKTSSEGMSASEAFKSLEGSITAARERGVVKMMGATIDLASSLGKQYEAMSKSEKAQAMLNAVTEQAAKVERALGDEYDSAADKIQRYKNQIEALKLTIGDFALRLSAALFGAVQSIAGSISIIIGGILKVFELSSMLTDKVGITSEAAQGWREAAEAARMSGENLKDLAQANYDLAISGRKAASGTGEALGGDAGVNVKRAEQLAEVMKKIREAQTLAEASELDKSRIQNDIWFEDQVKKLRDLGASDAEYSALVVAYAAKRHADLTSWANKTSDFYLEVQRANVKENDEIEKDRNRLLYEELERGARERQAIEDAYAKGSGDESDAIRRKAAGEREILAIRQAALLASITEQTTFAETLKIMLQYAALENQIEESKRRQVVDLDARRLQIERDIFNLKERQAEIVRQSNLQTAQEAIGKLGAGGAGVSSAMTLASDIGAGQDRYTREFTEWSKAQYDRIALLEELGGREAEIKEYWREWDLQQEQMVQQQKLAMASAGFGMMAGMMQSFYAASGNQNKAAFELYKTFAIGQTVIDTYRAAQGAYAALAGIPIVGPALGIAAAAAAIAAGMARVQAIQSAQPGGGMSMSAGGGGGVPALSTAAAGASKPAETVISPVVNIYVTGVYGDIDAVAREMVPAITKAVADGVR